MTAGSDIASCAPSGHAPLLDSAMAKGWPAKGVERLDRRNPSTPLDRNAPLGRITKNANDRRDPDFHPACGPAVQRGRAACADRSSPNIPWRVTRFRGRAASVSYASPPWAGARGVARGWSIFYGGDTITGPCASCLCKVREDRPEPIRTPRRSRHRRRDQAYRKEEPMSTFGDDLIQSLNEALAHATGKGPAIVHTPPRRARFAGRPSLLRCR